MKKWKKNKGEETWFSEFERPRVSAAETLLKGLAVSGLSRGFKEDGSWHVQKVEKKVIDGSESGKLFDTCHELLKSVSVKQKIQEKE